MIGAATGTPLYAESDPLYTGAVTRAGFTVSEGTNNSWDAATQTVTIKSNYLDSEADPNWAANSNSVLSHLGDTNTNPHGITRTMLGAAYTGDVVYAIAANGITNTPDGDGLIDLGTVGGDNTSTVTGRQIKVGSELNLTPNYGYVIGKRSGVTADNGMALGYRASVTDENAFVWSDASSDSAFNSRGSNTFSVRASGGTYIDTPTFEITGDAVFGNRVTLHDDGSGGGKIGITRTAGGGTTERYIGYRRIDVGRFGTYTNVGDVVPSQEFAYLSDFTNYLDLAGTRAMTGDLNMGNGVITNVMRIASLWDQYLRLIGPVGSELLIGDAEVFFNGVDAWQYYNYTNVWAGRVNDTEASRIAALPVSPMTFNSTSWLQSDGTNLFFVSTVPPGFTNALTTNAP